MVVRVSDRGPGLDPDEYERVFEPFYRGNSELSMHRGPGLGLAIAKGFVETNGGRIWVEPGAGREPPSWWSSRWARRPDPEPRADARGILRAPGAPHHQSRKSVCRNIAL